MWLARKEDGKPVAFFSLWNEKASKHDGVVRPDTEERVWRFYPHLGYENDKAESHLCKPGFAAIAKTQSDALRMIGE